MGGELGIILVYVVGMALIIAEVVLPGIVIGLVGLACVLGSIYWAFQARTGLGITLTAITVLSIPVLALLWYKVFNKVMAMKHTQAGNSVAQIQYKDLVGQEGVTLTMLRPAGMARFGNMKVDVVAEGEVVDRDSRVRVIEVRGNRVVVRAVNG